MSQRTYSDEQINPQLNNEVVENDFLQAEEGDFIISGNYELLNDLQVKIPKGIELYFLPDENYCITDALIKKLKKQEKISSVGYYYEDEWYEVHPKIYREGDLVPNYYIRTFPEGMISQVGQSHTLGINKKTSIANLLVQIGLAKGNNERIRCFWTANKLTNHVLCPKLFFK